MNKGIRTINAPEKIALHAKTKTSAPLKLTTTVFALFLSLLANVQAAENEFCTSGNCENGFGKTEFSSTLEKSNVYEGNFKNSKKSGQGTIKIVYLAPINNASIYSYSGEWKDDEKDGKGTEIRFDQNNNEIEKYVGEWKEDKRNGQGKLYKNGKLVHSGNFSNGYVKKLKGCVAGDCTNGYGVYIYPDKKGYIGQFKSGSKNGNGLNIDAKQGAFYIGGWENDKENGSAKIFNLDNEIMFSGEFANGNPVTPPVHSGQELGCVLGNCENGFGHYKFDNGDTYIGEFANGAQHGHGTHHFKDGTKHVGYFENGLQHGGGKYLNAEGVVVLEGVFINGALLQGSKIEKQYTDQKKCLVGDCIDGFGIYIETFTPGWKDAYRDYVNTFEVRYEGFWKNGKKHGLGFQEDRMSNRYVGEFNKDEATGKGVINFHNGNMYSGEIKDGAMHGYGTMTYADGTSYSGQWDNGSKAD